MLKTLFTGTPKWQSSNADERLNAVADLAPDDIALQTLAASDADTRVRAAAAARLNSVPALTQLVNDPEASVRDAAAKQWASLLGDAPFNSELPLAVIAYALNEHTSAEHKAAALQRAQAQLPDWLRSAAPIASKLDAISSSNDITTLESLHLYWRDHDKRLGKAAHDRVVALQSAEKNNQEADVLLAQMQSWAEADEVPLTKLVEAQRAWGKLTVDNVRSARYEKLLTELQQDMQNEAAVRRLHEALAMQVAGLSLKSKKVSELDSTELTALAQDATQAQSSPVLDAALAQQLQQVHSAIASEQQLRERNAAGEALLATRPAKPVTIAEAPAVSVVEPAIETVVAVSDAVVPSETPTTSAVGDVIVETPASETAVEVPATETGTVTPEVAMTESSVNVLTETTAAPANTTTAPSPEQTAYNTAYAAWKAEWDLWLASVDAPTREHFEKRLAKLDKPEKAKVDRPVQARASDAEIAAATDALTKLAELIAAGDVRGSRQAASNLFKQFTAKRYGKLEEQRLNELDGEVKRLESWLKWSDGQARDGLLAKAEALKASPLPPDALAKEVRALQDEWKALDKKNGGAPKPKWDRFNAICKEAYAPAKAHFDALRKQRNDNASGREKTIDALKALADEAATPLAEGENRDWLGLEKRKASLFDEWKKGGGVANAAWKALDEKFDAALKTLDSALDAARQPEITRRKQLIVEAETLAQATPSREVTEKTIALQRRWNGERPTNLPHLRRKDEQKLWDEFKKHTDAVFKARDVQRDQSKAQFSEATKARFAVIDEVKALTNGDDAKAIEAAISAARSKWRGLPLVEREKSRDFERKFDDALTAAKRRSTLLSRGSVIEAMKAVLADISATESADKTAGALVIDAELISGIDSPAEIATARRMQQLRWLSERRQLPTSPDAKITALRTLLGAFNATGAKITLGERERLTRAIEAVGAA